MKITFTYDGDRTTDSVEGFISESIDREGQRTYGTIESIEAVNRKLRDSFSLLVHFLADKQQLTADQVFQLGVGYEPSPRNNPVFGEDLIPIETEPPPVSPEKQKLLDELKVLQDGLEPLIRECLAAAREGKFMPSATFIRASDLLNKKSQVETQLASTP